MVQWRKLIFLKYKRRCNAEMCRCWVLLATDHIYFYAITLLTFNTVAQILSTVDRKYRRTVPLYFLMQRFLI